MTEGPRRRRPWARTITPLALALLLAGSLSACTVTASNDPATLTTAAAVTPAAQGAADTDGGGPGTPLVSRGKMVVAPGVDQPGGVVDGHYCTWPAWRTASLPTWLAINVGQGPSRLLLVWSSNYTFDYTGDGSDTTYGIPASYTIATSPDSSNGSNGTWTTVATVHDNFARAGEQSIPFSGQSWVKMTVQGVIPKTANNTLAIDEIDLFDTSARPNDAVFFLGDSITAGAYSRCDQAQPSFAVDVQRDFPNRFPAMIDGGVGGVTADYGAKNIDQWLAANPDFHYWAIQYGTNDAWQTRSPQAFAQDMQTIIDKVKAAGRVPILARIPYATKGPNDANVQALNGVIDQLTARNHLTAGPDFYAWFKAHPDQLGSDGVHPNDAGDIAMNQLWANVFRVLDAAKAATK